MRLLAPATPLALLLALLVAMPAAGIEAQGEASGWRIVRTIDSTTAGAQKMFEAFDTASLNLYDFNGDGTLEIVSQNDNNRVYVIDPRAGRVLAELETYHYNSTSWPVRTLNPVAIGDLYGDGVPCMVVPNDASFVTAFCYDAAASTATSFSFVKKWQIKVDASKYEPDFKEKHPWLYDANGSVKKEYSLGMDGNAYLADVDGDGTKEIFVENDGFPGQFSFAHDGTYRWSRSFWDGNGGAQVRDIDKDGTKEAVFVSDSGAVASYNARTGGLEWIFDAGDHGAWPGSIPVPALVVDLHGDGRYETFVGARNVSTDQSDPQWVNKSHARYFLLDSKGKPLWTVSYDWMNPMMYNHPAPIDVNGDGTLDIIVLDWNTVGHKPGNWNTTNRSSNLFALDGRDGSALWHVGVGVYWSNKDFVVADVDGDGKQEIVAPGSRVGVEGLEVRSLQDGSFQGFFPIGQSLSRGPVAGNLFGDGKLYFVVPTMKRIHDRPNYRSVDVGYREGFLQIVETGAAYNVKFSANFLHSDDQKDAQHQGTIGTPPPTPTPTPATPTAATPTPPSPTPTPTASPPPSPTPTASPPATTPEPTATPTAATSTPTVDATPTATAATKPVPTPSPTPTTEPTESVDTPGPGLALVLAAVAGAVVALRRRR